MDSSLETPIWKPKPTTRIVHGGVVLMHGGPVGMHLPEHEHEEVQLEMHLNPTRGTDPGRIGMTPSFFHLVPASKPHVGFWADRTEVVVALLSPQQLGAAAEELLVRGRPETKSIVTGMDPLFQSCSTLLREEFLAQRNPDTLLVEAVGTVLSGWIIRRWSASPSPRKLHGKLSRRQLEKTISVVRDRAGERLQISDLAKELKMGVHQFTREFRETVGRTPYQFIIDHRIDLACSLLENSSRSIAEIAYETGFVSQSHLTSTFRRRLKVTPDAFRVSRRSGRPFLF